MEQTKTMTDTAVTITTIEIAELTGKRHDNVMRDTRNMLDALGAALSSEDTPYADTYVDSQGKAQPCFRLDKDLTMALITGYDVKLRLSVVKRLRELEEAASPSLASMSPMEFIDYQYKRLKELEAANELMAPKAAVHDRFMAAEGSRSLRDTAKALGYGPHKFNKQLHADGYLFKQGDVWEPYADHIESGLFVLTVREVNGTNQKQTRVTPKGMDALATRYPVKVAA